MGILKHSHILKKLKLFLFRRVLIIESEKNMDIDLDNKDSKASFDLHLAAREYNQN